MEAGKGASTHKRLPFQNSFALGDLLSFLAPPMDKEKLRVEILESIYEDYADREELPHYGLIPDWYLRYKDLSKLVIEYLNMP